MHVTMSTASKKKPPSVVSVSRSGPFPSDGKVLHKHWSISIYELQTDSPCRNSFQSIHRWSSEQRKAMTWTLIELPVPWNVYVLVKNRRYGFALNIAFSTISHTTLYVQFPESPSVATSRTNAKRSWMSWTSRLHKSRAIISTPLSNKAFLCPQHVRH